MFVIASDSITSAKIVEDWVDKTISSLKGVRVSYWVSQAEHYVLHREGTNLVFLPNIDLRMRLNRRQSCEERGVQVADIRADDYDPFHVAMLIEKMRQEECGER